jgi:hypothetical protein
MELAECTGRTAEFYLDGHRSGIITGTAAGSAVGACRKVYEARSHGGPCRRAASRTGDTVAPELPIPRTGARRSFAPRRPENGSGFRQAMAHRGRLQSGPRSRRATSGTSDSPASDFTAIWILLSMRVALHSPSQCKPCRNFDRPAAPVLSCSRQFSMILHTTVATDRARRCRTQSRGDSDRLRASE